MCTAALIQTGTDMSHVPIPQSVYNSRVGALCGKIVFWCVERRPTRYSSVSQCTTRNKEDPDVPVCQRKARPMMLWSRWMRWLISLLHMHTMICRNIAPSKRYCHEGWAEREFQCVSTWCCFSVGSHGGVYVRRHDCVSVWAAMMMFQCALTWWCFSVDSHDDVYVCQHDGISMWSSWWCYSVGRHDDILVWDVMVVYVCVDIMVFQFVWQFQCVSTCCCFSVGCHDSIYMCRHDGVPVWSSWWCFSVGRHDDIPVWDVMMVYMCVDMMVFQCVSTW